MARTTVELVWTDCVDTALCVDTEHEDGFREFMDGDEVVVCHAADADPAAEVEALRKRAEAAERAVESLGQRLGEWQRGERLHPSETQAHAAGAEQVLARVRGRLDQDDKAAYYNVRLGERLRRLRRDLEAMLTNAVGQTPCTVCGRPRHDNHCNEASPVPAPEEAPAPEVPATEAPSVAVLREKLAMARRERNRALAELREVRAYLTKFGLAAARAAGVEEVRAQVREVLDALYAKGVTIGSAEAEKALLEAVRSLAALVGDAPEAAPPVPEADGPFLLVDGFRAWLEDLPPDKRQAAREVLGMIRELLVEVVPPPQVGGHAQEEAEGDDDC